MSLRLKEIFDACPWENKFLNRLPGDQTGVRFRWFDEDADKALKFFEDLGALARCSEVSPERRRSLYFGRDGQGRWQLCVHEVQNDDYDPDDDGRGRGCRIDPLRTI